MSEHVFGSLEIRFRHVHPGKGRLALRSHIDEVSLAPSAVEHFKLDDATRRNLAIQDQLPKTRGHARISHLHERALVRQKTRHYRQAFSITERLSRSIPDIVRNRFTV